MDPVTKRAKILKALTGLGSPQGRRALARGVAATGDHAALLTDLNPSSVLDVGGNRGQFGLDVWASCPTAQLLAFEPIPDAARTYRTIFRKHPHCEVRTTALGRRSGESLLHLSRADDSSSLLPISEMQATTFPGTEEVSTLTVPVSTLDKELEGANLVHPILLKADVQGSELDVLVGAMETLKITKWVYLECSFAEFYSGQQLAGEITDWLHDAGFVLSGIGSTTIVDGRVVQADLLFANRRI